jgi:hypothetical protein
MELTRLLAAAAFFTTYEVLKEKLPKLVPALQDDGRAPILHMLSASGGEVVSSPPSFRTASDSC